ncbi:hypothetical protein JCM21900_000311 [Sporobolomyces salmonicolor]
MSTYASVTAGKSSLASAESRPGLSPHSDPLDDTARGDSATEDTATDDSWSIADLSGRHHFRSTSFMSKSKVQEQAVAPPQEQAPVAHGRKSTRPAPSASMSTSSSSSRPKKQARRTTSHDEATPSTPEPAGPLGSRRRTRASRAASPPADLGRKPWRVRTTIENGKHRFHLEGGPASNTRKSFTFDAAVVDARPTIADDVKAFKDSAEIPNAMPVDAIKFFLAKVDELVPPAEATPDTFLSVPSFSTGPTGQPFIILFPDKRTVLSHIATAGVDLSLVNLPALKARFNPDNLPVPPAAAKLLNNDDLALQTASWILLEAYLASKTVRIVRHRPTAQAQKAEAVKVAKDVVAKYYPKEPSITFIYSFLSKPVQTKRPDGTDFNDQMEHLNSSTSEAWPLEEVVVVRALGGTYDVVEIRKEDLHETMDQESATGSGIEVATASQGLKDKGKDKELETAGDEEEDLAEGPKAKAKQEIVRWWKDHELFEDADAVLALAQVGVIAAALDSQRAIATASLLKKQAKLTKESNEVVCEMSGIVKALGTVQKGYSCDGVRQSVPVNGIPLDGPMEYSLFSGRLNALHHRYPDYCTFLHTRFIYNDLKIRSKRQSAAPSLDVNVEPESSPNIETPSAADTEHSRDKIEGGVDTTTSERDSETLSQEQSMMTDFTEDTYAEDHLEPCPWVERATQSAAEYVQTFGIGAAYESALKLGWAHPTPTIGELFQVELRTDEQRQSFLRRVLVNHIAVLESRLFLLGDRTHLDSQELVEAKASRAGAATSPFLLRLSSLSRRIATDPAQLSKTTVAELVIRADVLQDRWVEVASRSKKLTTVTRPGNFEKPSKKQHRAFGLALKKLVAELEIRGIKYSNVTGQDDKFPGLPRLSPRDATTSEDLCREMMRLLVYSTPKPARCREHITPAAFYASFVCADVLVKTSFFNKSTFTTPSLSDFHYSSIPLVAGVSAGSKHAHMVSPGWTFNKATGKCIKKVQQVSRDVKTMWSYLATVIEFAEDGLTERFAFFPPPA